MPPHRHDDAEFFGLVAIILIALYILARAQGVA